MKLQDLEGFVELPFFKLDSFGTTSTQEHKKVLTKTGVYIFRLNKTFSRLSGGETDILYIGCTGKRTERSIANRMIDYRRGHAQAPQYERVNKTLSKLIEGGSEIRFFNDSSVRKENRILKVEN